MNEIPPPSPPDEPAPKDGPAPSPPASGDGCLFVIGVFGGFFLFLLGGWMVLVASKSQIVGWIYLLGTLVTAVWLATKPGFRGLAIGIFLGLGAFALLIAICSGTHF